MIEVVVGVSGGVGGEQRNSHACLRQQLYVKNLWDPPRDVGPTTDTWRGVIGPE